MSKNEIKTDLFRFVTLRNPQTIDEKDKERGFVFFPSNEKSNSHYLDQLDLETDVDGRRSYIEGRTASFNNLTTKALVRNVNQELFDFSVWLMKNKKTLTATEVATKTTGLIGLTTAQLVNLWDNLIYQIDTKKSKAVREAIIQLIVANNFLDKNDISSLGNDKLINDDTELSRLACAFVVIPDNVSNNWTRQETQSRTAESKDYKVLEEKLLAFDAVSKLAIYERALDEIHTAILDNKAENKTSYETAHATYRTDLDTAYANATENVDSTTGETYYTGLVLPKFSHTPTSIFDDGYLDGKVNATTLQILSNAKDDGISDEDALIEEIEAKAAMYNQRIAAGETSNKKSIRYNGSVITADLVNLPYFSYALGIGPALHNNTKVQLALNVATGYKNPTITASDIDLNFGGGNITNLTNLLVAESDGKTAIVAPPVSITLPEGSTSVTVTGTIDFDNGDTMELASTTLTLDSKIYGAQGTNKTAQLEKEIIENFGISKMGVADFRRVEQEVCCYVPGEVSHIENILAKEYKERSTRNLISSENTTETTNESEVENLTDTTTSERSELSTEVSTILNEDEFKNYGASAGVNGNFGKVSFFASGYFDGGSASSSSNSNSEAQTYAEEVTNRALERVVQKVTRKRTSRILREFEENNKHGFDNREGTSHVTGVYRWVDKIYNNRLVNYGKRLMYEFNVPEPARFLRDAIFQAAVPNEQIPGLPGGLILPEPPVPLPGNIKDSRDIKRQNYQMLASRYGAEVNAPPRFAVHINNSFSYFRNTAEEGHELYSETKTLKIPEGYQAVAANAYASGMQDNDGNSGKGISVTVRNLNFTVIGDMMPERKERMLAHDSNPLNPQTEELSMSAYFTNFLSGTIAVSVRCELMAETFQQWQVETYDAIIKAYEARVQEYNDSLLATFVPEVPEADDTKIEFNPLLNRALEKRELKRAAIGMMARPFKIKTGINHFKGGSTTEFYQTAYFARHASTVKFFEQAFDWEIMAYVFDPYFYADEDDWKTLFQESNGTDPIFQAFLQSGMARMVVPVRPGFEDAVTFFLETGEVWLGNGLALESDDDLYLSIADETQTVEGTVEKEWETRVPTALTIVQSDSAPLTENGLPCCSNEDQTENLGYGSSIMVGQSTSGGA